MAVGLSGPSVLQGWPRERPRPSLLLFVSAWLHMADPAAFRKHEACSAWTKMTSTHLFLLKSSTFSYFKKSKTSTDHPEWGWGVQGTTGLSLGGSCSGRRCPFTWPPEQVLLSVLEVSSQPIVQVMAAPWGQRKGGPGKFLASVVW